MGEQIYRPERDLLQYNQRTLGLIGVHLKVVELEFLCLPQDVGERTPVPSSVCQWHQEVMETQILLYTSPGILTVQIQQALGFGEDSELQSSLEVFSRQNLEEFEQLQ